MLAQTATPEFAVLFLGGTGGSRRPGQTLRFDLQNAALGALQELQYATKCVRA